MAQHCRLIAAQRIVGHALGRILPQHQFPPEAAVPLFKQMCHGLYQTRLLRPIVAAAGEIGLSGGSDSVLVQRTQIACRSAQDNGLGAGGRLEGRARDAEKDVAGVAEAGNVAARAGEQDVGLPRLTVELLGALPKALQMLPPAHNHDAQPVNGPAQGGRLLKQAGHAAVGIGVKPRDAEQHLFFRGDRELPAQPLPLCGVGGEQSSVDAVDRDEDVAPGDAVVFHEIAADVIAHGKTLAAPARQKAQGKGDGIAAVHRGDKRNFLLFAQGGEQKGRDARMGMHDVGLLLPQDLGKNFSGLQHAGERPRMKRGLNVADAGHAQAFDKDAARGDHHHLKPSVFQL